MSEEKFSLVWNTFTSNLSSGLLEFITGEELVDVTLAAAEGKILRAHKLILSVCSSYFRELFKENNCKHPIVILKDVSYRDLLALLHFMYQGEVNIKQEDIPSFLKVAEVLQVKGLTKNFNDDNNEKEVEEEDEILTPEPNVSPQKEAESPMESQHNRTVVKEEAMSPMPRDDFPVPENFSETPNPVYKKKKYFRKESRMTEEPLNFTPQSSNVFMSESTSSMNYNPVVDEENIITSFDQSTSSQEQDPTHFQGMEYSQQYQELSETSREGKVYQRPSNPENVGETDAGKLPLETTLRVISEIGPTLRMERGKVIRMYSCPWCLRHFTRRENLKLHVTYIHNGPLESLTCKQCGNKYKNSNSLRVHSYLYHNAKRIKHTKPGNGPKKDV